MIGRILILSAMIAGVWFGGIWLKIALTAFMVVAWIFTEVSSRIIYIHDHDINQLKQSDSARRAITTILGRLG